MSVARILALVGATATGKTAIGERLAQELDAEIVCADSRQVFREIDVGTGKPDRAARARLPHHLFDARSIAETASAGWYAREARRACRDVLARGKRPLLVGGSGLYLRALMRGLAAVPPHDPVVRERLAAEWRDAGSEAMHRRLELDDPESAVRLAPRDSQRVLRALEVLESSGRPLSWWHRQPREGALEGEWRVVELVVAPRALAERIGRRMEWMFAHGLIEETRAIVGSGLGDALRRLRAVGYDEALAWIEGALALEPAVELAARRTRQLAKRQRTWFRHQLDAVRLEAERGDEASLARAAREALTA